MNGTWGDRGSDFSCAELGLRAEVGPNLFCSDCALRASNHTRPARLTILYFPTLPVWATNAAMPPLDNPLVYLFRGSSWVAEFSRSVFLPKTVCQRAGNGAKPNIFLAFLAQPDYPRAFTDT